VDYEEFIKNFRISFEHPEFSVNYCFLTFN